MSRCFVDQRLVRRQAYFLGRVLDQVLSERQEVEPGVVYGCRLVCSWASDEGGVNRRGSDVVFLA